MKKRGKILALEEFDKKKLDIDGKRTVLVGGCFVLLHYGHFIFLKKAKRVGDYLIVALESDEFIRRNKKKIPIHNQRQRAEILAALDLVDMVVLLPYFTLDNDYFNMVKKIRPAVIAVTAGDPLKNNKRKQARAVGGRLKVVTPLIQGFSSQRIINSLDL